METRKIQYRDRTTNLITIFQSKENNCITLICLPAMGVRASYYELFATSLCKKGFNVITADYRGHGNSSVRASRNINYGYEEIIGDVKELVEHTDIWFPNSKKIIIGHSLGGQIGSLFESRYSKVSGLMHLHVSSDETKIVPLNHFSWAKHPDYFVQLMEDWIQEN